MWSSISDNIFCSLALTPCYTEYSVKYYLANDGLTDLNADETDRQQDSIEDCRTHCRHLSSFIFHGSQEGGFQNVQIFVSVGTHMKTQSTSLTIGTTTIVFVSQTTTWMLPGNISTNKFLAMSIAMVSLNSQEYSRAENIQWPFLHNYANLGH